jgi:Formate hydrogenlyase subunit 6/NADH:ubiquinone oxidoreductase 23 kD subunit (chain I)
MASNNTKAVKKEERVIGGKKVSVAVVKPLDVPASIPSALAGLAKGMLLTLGYLLHPSKIVTRQYPENRKTLKFPQRYRAMLHLIYEENGYHRCTACRMCEKACPNRSIRILSRKGEISGKIELDRYIWRLDSCIFCNACVQSCPFGALEMGHEFENAVYDRRLLIFTLNRYAGPPASVLNKQENAEIRRKMTEPRDRYGGPVPLNGTAVPIVQPLMVKPAQKPGDIG